MTYIDILEKWAIYSKYDSEQTSFNLLSANYMLHKVGKLIEMLLSEYDNSGMLAVVYANKTVQREVEGLSEDDYRIEYKEKATGMVKVINLSIGCNPYWENIYREGFISGKYELISGKLPDWWKEKMPQTSEEL